MAYKKVTVVLSGEKGKCGILKLSGDFDGKKSVAISLSPAEVFGRGEENRLYVLGDGMTEVPLEKGAAEYKAAVSARGELICLAVADGEYYSGGTGKTPSLKEIKRRVAERKNNAAVSTPAPAKNLYPTEELVPSIAEEPVSTIAEEKKAENVSPQPEETRQSEEIKKCVKQPPIEASAEPTCSAEPTLSADSARSAAQSVTEDKPVSPFVLDDCVTYDGTNFYLAVKPQLDELFVCYPEDKPLSAAVPNSKWAHVDTEDGYYVVGIIFDGTAASYICYGVPSLYTRRPPDEIADVSVWLPLDPKHREGEGYWVIYQSAVDGKCVR